MPHHNNKYKELKKIAMHGPKEDNPVVDSKEYFYMLKEQLRLQNKENTLPENNR